MTALVRRLLALSLVCGLGLGLGGPPAAAMAAPTPPAETIVSLTFDDGWRDQYAAAQYLDVQNVSATFYLNSDQVAAPAYLTLPMLRSLDAMGHQIAGHTSTHPHLIKLEPSEAEREICNDRAGLTAMGFEATDFAYPYGQYNATVAQLASQCGYNSARTSSGLYNSPADCSRCPVAESLPLDHRFNIRTATTVRQPDPLAQMQAQVKRALTTGGWLPLVFHHICQPGQACKGESIQLSDFKRFVEWLKLQPVKIAAVREVTGGRVQEVRGEVTPRVQAIIAQNAPPAAGGEAEPLSKAVAFRVLGLGIGQLQVIMVGIALALVFLMSFRLGTRHHRYRSQA